MSRDMRAPPEYAPVTGAQAEMKSAFDETIEAGLGPASLFAAAVMSLKHSLDELSERVAAIEGAGQRRFRS